MIYFHFSAVEGLRVHISRGSGQRRSADLLNLASSFSTEVRRPEPRPSIFALYLQLYAELDFFFGARRVRELERGHPGRPRMTFAAGRAVKIPKRQARARIANFLRQHFSNLPEAVSDIVQKVSRALPPAAPPMTFHGRLPFSTLSLKSFLAAFFFLS
jgi:hypothetical protein